MLDNAIAHIGQSIVVIVENCAKAKKTEPVKIKTEPAKIEIKQEPNVTEKPPEKPVKTKKRKLSAGTSGTNVSGKG